MSELDDLLATFSGHQGVEQLVLLGRDGLVVKHLGGTYSDVEALAARIPGLATASEAVGTAGALDNFRTAVLEFDAGVAIVVTLSMELLLVAVVSSGVGFAPLLRDLRVKRDRLIQLL
jgi:predicted regulator of Ras-like GTPase activity (Roadblock/LC7/MglB family)